MRNSFIDLDSESEDEYKEVFLRAYVMGCHGVGKTSFIKRLLYNTFSITYYPTRAIEIYKKKTFFRLGIKLSIELVDVPQGFLIKDVQPNDIMVIIHDEKEYDIPKIPIRTWLLYRKKHLNICPSYRKIRIENMENIGIDTFINSLIQEYT